MAEALDLTAVGREQFGASAGKTATPVEPGTQDVTADVQVTYAIS